MVDPLSLTVLGGVAAAEGIKFLWGQAAELIKAWNSRRVHDKDEELNVPIVPATILDQPPSTAKVDPGVLERQEATLIRLAGSLSSYALGLAPVKEQNEALAADAGQLRSVLEAVYGQRFTFRGEPREPTGTRVTIDQVIGELHGEAVGLYGQPTADETAIDQKARVVGPQGRLYGQVAETDGAHQPGSPARPSDPSAS